MDTILLENTNLDHDTLNIDIENSSTSIYCKGCRKKCDSNLFYDLIQNKTYKQCSDCRHRAYARRHNVTINAQPDTSIQYPMTCEC